MFILTFTWLVGLMTLVLTFCRLDVRSTDKHRVINAAMHLYFIENYEEFVRHHRIRARSNLINESERQEINDQWKETLGLEKLNAILKKFEDHWLYTLDVAQRYTNITELTVTLHAKIMAYFFATYYFMLSFFACRIGTLEDCNKEEYYHELATHLFIFSQLGTKPLVNHYKSIANDSLDDALHKMVISEFTIRIEKLAEYYRELSSNSETEIFEKKTVKITSLKDIKWYTTFRDLMPPVVEHLIFETGINLEMAVHSIMYGPFDISLRFNYCDDISAFKQCHYQPFAIKSLKLCEMLTRHVEQKESEITRVIKELVLTSFEPSKVPLEEISDLMDKFKERGKLEIRSTPNKFLHNIGLHLLLVDNSNKKKLLKELKKNNPSCFK